MQIKIVAGHNPDLVVFNDTETIRIDLTEHKTLDALHTLVQSYGFKNRNSNLKNLHNDCFVWQNNNECQKNPAYMKQNCALACSLKQEL